ncbi:MAG: SMP-30/gluconolactonase/LRE family protein [Acidimicrobiales bacterium]
MIDHRTRVIHDGLAFGEAPRWHEGRLWFSDFYRHGVFSVSGDGRDERREFTVPGQPSGLGWTPDGALLAVSMTDQRLVRLGPGPTDVRVVADLSPYCTFWANDLVVSSRGDAYVGNFGFDLDQRVAERGPAGLIDPPPPTTTLIAVDQGGRVVQVIDGLAFPNGAVITPDESTLIVAETMAARLSAFTIAADGTLHDRREWAALPRVAPDGICLDGEGQVWVANARAAECLRVREGGEISARATTTQTAYACALGGDDRRTLYVMSAPSSNRFTIGSTTRAAIESCRVDVPGAGLP